MKLSIITVNYNNCGGLQKTIESVMEQKWKDYEWLIIDGGSTDGSKELIERYNKNFSYSCCEKDNGIYDAMNKGITKAKGDYIHFLNSGDFLFDRNVYSSVFSNMIDSDVIYGNTVIIKDGKTTIDKGFHSDYLSLYNFLNRSICHQAAFIKKELFTKYGLYDLSLQIVADWKFFIDTLIVNKCSVKYIDYNIVYYSEDGFSCKNEKKRKDEQYSVLKNILPEYALYDYFNLIKENEIRKFKVTRYLYSLLYRIANLYNRYIINKQ